MNEVPIGELKRAVESRHGAKATYVQSVPVHEERGGQTLWSGTVQIFNLADHPLAARAYAWSCTLEGGQRGFMSVLHMPPVTGPREAVRASTGAEHNAKP